MIGSIHRDISNETCVMGRLYVEGIFINYTMERPWLDNQNDISCVPDGVYDVVPHDSEKYGEVLALVNPALGVYYRKSDRPKGKGRYMCLLAHVGNWAKNVKGCVALGTSRGDNAVWNSGDAIESMHQSGVLDYITTVVITSDEGLHNELS